MGKPLVIDVDVVTDITTELLAVAGLLAEVTRPMRLPMMNPASDPLTVHICIQINHTRGCLGIAGSDAADELTRMAQFIRAAAFNLKSTARSTSLAALGLSAAPLVPREVDVAGRVTRALPAPHRNGAWTIEADDQALSCAVLVCAGDDEVSAPLEPDPRELRALGDRLHGCGAQMSVAWPNATAAAATLDAFGHWISTSFAGACERSMRAVSNWNTLYTQMRSGLAEAAQLYASAQRALISGRALEAALDANPSESAGGGAISTERVRSLLAQYEGFNGATALPPDFPRLKV